MNSYIVSGGQSTDRSNFIQNKLSSKIELIHVVAEKTSIGIKQIQALNIPLSIESRLERLVWIEEANLMTIPSQNALLKMLEEPPFNTSFYLTCAQKSALLPTIRSRATSIILDSNTLDSPNDVLADLKTIMSLTPGDRLAAIIKRDREESILWILQIEQALRIKLAMTGQNDKSYRTLGKIAKLAQNAHLELLSNCSVGLTTQNFYLLLPHTVSPK